ncbi:MAG: efflux RND transporter periplasmic adaptor subunit [Planctomycetota bacterium]
MTNPYKLTSRCTAAVALLLGLLASGAGCTEKVSDNGLTATVTSGEIEVVIRAKGALQARNYTRIHSEVEMEAKIIDLVKEGEMVKTGDLLVKLDPTDLQKRIDDKKVTLDQALVNLDAATAEVQIQETDNKNKLDRATLTAKQSKQEMEKYKQGDAPIQRRKLEIRLEETDSDLKRKNEKYGQMPELLREGFVTPSQVEEERINVEKAKVEWETAKRELEVFKTYRHPMELERKKSEVTQALSDLEAVKKRNASQLKQRQVNRQGQANRVGQLREEIRDLESKLTKMIILAPTGGLVIYGAQEERHWRRGGGDDIAVGSRVWPQKTIITLPDLSEMTVKFRIHESDINKIKPGMSGIVTVESFGKRSFTGRITRIAKLANTGGWRFDPEVKEFDVEMLLEGRDLGLMPGVSASIEIITAKAENVLRVPVTAIHGRPGAYFCVVDGSGGKERKDIVLGLISDTHAEVKTGLAQGDRVVLGPPPDLGGKPDDGKGDKASEKSAPADKGKGTSGKSPGKGWSGAKSAGASKSGGKGRTGKGSGRGKSGKRPAGKGGG